MLKTGGEFSKGADFQSPRASAGLDIAFVFYLSHADIVRTIYKPVLQTKEREVSVAQICNHVFAELQVWEENPLSLHRRPDLNDRKFVNLPKTSARQTSASPRARVQRGEWRQTVGERIPERP